MHGRGKSDSAIVPEKSSNKAGASDVAEMMEGRALAKGNAGEDDVGRTQSRKAATSGLERVRQAAKKCHPWPFERFAAITQGRSPVR